ncbi:hypothetical protein IMZ08_14075 [Bacillus luteolus]|uniref:Uncharacterized protein n=1 Tax=Litchfieldia luteola TaxID=682179 RepID=A0ABR9QKZ9_9BACI|nr:hypothetical protein [Cytobacillus luteolus]MBE4909190.1 hypothetical protein [Cytobacillus luteolus]MBP1940357.1 hydrogenase maturation factor HypF (carbamoyltransferase family) [Cytobacillus luteolus]
MNLNLLSRQGTLENQLNNLYHSINDINSTVYSQTDELRNVINNMKEEQSWISRINMDFDPSKVAGSKAFATFNWQVRELQGDSEVLFHYAVGEGDDYRAIPADELQPGVFQVQVPVEIKLEPMWEVGVITTTSSNIHEETKQAIEEKMIKQDQEHRMKYFVSVTYGNLVKNGEIHTENLGHYGTKYYGILRADIHLFENTLNVSLFNDFVDRPSSYVEKAFLLKYEGSTAIGEEEIILEDQNQPEDEIWPRFFHLADVERKDNMRYTIKVIFANGETYEKEVYQSTE